MGTGSSAGDATDEYPLVERTDLCTVIAWLAEQDWCDGNVGMFGTSYSGFNSLQIAAERPLRERHLPRADREVHGARRRELLSDLVAGVPAAHH